MINLKYDMRAADTITYGVSPLVIMRKLGIKYALAVPQSISDSWWFLCCENLPKELPSYLNICMEDNEFKKYIGWGLSEGDCELLDKLIAKDNN